MTLVLQMGTRPKNLEVKSVSGFGSEFFGGEGIHVGNYCLTMDDFCSMVRYIVVNTNLQGTEDPRLVLVEWFRQLQTMSGYTNTVDPHPDGLRRLGTP